MRNRDLRLDEAVKVVVAKLPEKYSDPRKAQLFLRSATIRRAIPGATFEVMPGKKQPTWMYDHDKLVKWLENPDRHRPGRPSGAKDREPRASKKMPQLQDA